MGAILVLSDLLTESMGLVVSQALLEVRATSSFAHAHPARSSPGWLRTAFWPVVMESSSIMEVVAALAAGVFGVALGAWLARRNEKQAATERLLVEAVNDLVDSVAGVAQSESGARARYASALARISLHGSPEVVRAFRDHQDDATTVTPEGRRLLMAAIQAARKELGHQPLDERDLEVLLFGSPSQREIASP
jgi:hypothetical protein